MFWRHWIKDFQFIFIKCPLNVTKKQELIVFKVFPRHFHLIIFIFLFLLSISVRLNISYFRFKDKHSSVCLKEFQFKLLTFQKCQQEQQTQCYLIEHIIYTCFKKYVDLPNVGPEYLTPRLRVSYSTDWAWDKGSFHTTLSSIHK